MHAYIVGLATVVILIMIVIAIAVRTRQRKSSSANSMMSPARHKRTKSEVAIPVHLMPNAITGSREMSNDYDGAPVVDRRQLLQGGAANELRCKAYTGCDFIESFELEGVEPDEVESFRVERSGEFTINYAVPPGAKIQASSWNLTPAVFTPRAEIILTLKSPPIGREIYVTITSVLLWPDVSFSLLRDRAQPPPAILGVNGHTVDVENNEYVLRSPENNVSTSAAASE